MGHPRPWPHIAGKFADDLALVPGARLHAVASRSFDRAKEFAKKYKAKYTFGSYEEMTDCPDLDVVYIASPHTFHCEHALLFLEKGIPVLCEKPLALNSSQVSRMVESARRNKVFFMEAIWTRFLPSFQKTLEIIDQKQIGDIRVIRADFGFSFPFNPNHRLYNMALGGGSLLDVGIYPVFIATWLMGRPASVQAMATFSPTGSDTLCGMRFRYDNDVMAGLDSAATTKTRCDGFIYGEKGHIHIHPRFHEAKSLSLHLHGKDPEHFDTPLTGWGYFHEIEEVEKCLRNGKIESEKLPLDFSILLMETLDRVRTEIGLKYPNEI